MELGKHHQLGLISTAMAPNIPLTINPRAIAQTNSLTRASVYTSSISNSRLHVRHLGLLVNRSGLSERIKVSPQQTHILGQQGHWAIGPTRK